MSFRTENLATENTETTEKGQPPKTIGIGLIRQTLCNGAPLCVLCALCGEMFFKP